MKKHCVFQLITICIILIISLMNLGGTNLHGQETDSFYLTIYQRGEKSFLAKNYEDAIKELEIAVFGLVAEKELKTKACIYLSLSFYHQNDLDKSKKYLNNAKNLKGDEEFASLELEESVSSELRELMNYFKEKETKRINIDSINELERKLRSDPRNEEFSYELFELYKQNNNLEDGKRTLKNLIKANPAAAKGYNLLGIMYYNEKKYKDAEKLFEKIFELTENHKIHQSLLEEAGTYLALSIYHEGDRRRALIIVEGLINYFTEEKISSLPLNQKDKVTLQNIIEISKRRSSVI